MKHTALQRLCALFGAFLLFASSSSFLFDASKMSADKAIKYVPLSSVQSGGAFASSIANNHQKGEFLYNGRSIDAVDKQESFYDASVVGLIFVTALFVLTSNTLLKSSGLYAGRRYNLLI